MPGPDRNASPRRQNDPAPRRVPVPDHEDTAAPTAPDGSEADLTEVDGGEPGESLWEGWDSEFVTSWWVEGFTEGADAEYDEQILPMAAHHLAGAVSVLDIGCGEGQVSRLAAAVPGVKRVVGVDPTTAQLRVASARGADVAYGRAAAAALPFPSSSFDTVIACLVFEHVDEVDAALAEVGRVLAPGGRFLFFLNHPLLQTPGSGWIDDRILEEQYWRVGPYLTEDTTLEQVDNGVWIPFIHRPLSRYVNALVGEGLLITRLEEPAPPPGFLDRAQEYAEAATIPRLLFIRAEKVGGMSR
jgi:ubiquinone/menaquinone biosynthesis C-methylase UbiE